MSIRDQMRGVMNQSNERKAERGNDFGQINLEQNRENLQKAPVTSTGEKHKILPRNPRLIPSLGELGNSPGLASGGESTELITARVTLEARSWIKGFNPLFVNSSKREGLGTKIQLMIQEILWHRTELRDHLSEIRDFLRQVQNSEKEYYSEIGKPAEEEARTSYQKSIKYLELVLNLKRLKYEKLMVLFQKGIVDQVFIDEIHYYMNIEVYEKWRSRGF